MIRSVPRRVMTVSWLTCSSSVPAYMRPPISEYSPSTFSRTTTKSMSAPVRFASGESMPGIRRTGRHVRVLLHLAPDRDQQLPQGHVVGHARPAHRAEEDRVVLVEPRHGVGRHHPARVDVALARPVEVGPLDPGAARVGGALGQTHAHGQHLGADAVAGDRGDAQGASGHGRASGVGGLGVSLRRGAARLPATPPRAPAAPTRGAAPRRRRARRPAGSRSSRSSSGRRS